MNGSLPDVSSQLQGAALPGHAELREEFLLFRDAAEALELAYAELQERVSRVDHDLADANRALQTALADRDAILGQLPIGVHRLEGARVVPLNPEARTIVERVPDGALHDWLAALPAGKWCETRLHGNASARDLRALRVELEEPGDTLWFVEDQTALRALREQVERLHRLGSLSELSLGVAHEVLNPLNGVAGFASLLRRSPDSPKAAVWAEHIEQGVVRIRRIVRDLLAFARPERRSAPCVRSLAEWFEEARPEAEGLELVLAQPQEPLLGSPEALGKVFANLVRNARQAGARRISVTVVREAGGGQLVRVQDDGPGIPEELAPRIFDPFVGTKDQGSGLGLAFCARALEAMGGGIRCCDGERGACFEVQLPEAGDDR